MRRKVQDVPRLPMGVTFTVSGDPSLRASYRRQGMVRTMYLGVGVILVFGCALLLTKLLTENQSFAKSTNPVVEHEAVTPDTVSLITASRRIERGSRISEDLLQQVKWPRDQVPEGAIRSAEEAASMFAIAAIPGNQPILRSSLSPNAPLSGLQDLLPAGHRAVTIPVNATTGIEGWATAGAHVDILLTYLDSREGVNKTRVIVENAIVLSLGGNAKARETNERGVVGLGFDQTTVTLAVPFKDSLKITTALEMGRISLALRNSTDVVTPGDGVFSSDEWDKRAAPVARPPASAKGYARLSGKDGRTKQFVLGEDNRWSDSQAEEFF